ncbi:MAG: VOC family protein [Gammaproteobacteria bacterium]|nr:VOC family protein [Gammaproteobacteria bacterium]
MSVKSICGVILISQDAEKLAAFYSQGLDLKFEKEDHGGLEVHYGVDIGELHFGIHPPSNFKLSSARKSGAVAFNVESIDQHLQKLIVLGAEEISPRHDEGFGDVVTLKDPEGNLFELVELKYQFENH